MGIEAIIARINDDAEIEARRIKTEAQTRADEIIREGEKKADHEYQAVINAGKREIRQLSAQKRSHVLITARRTVREMKESLVSRCFEQAAEELSTVRNSADYPGILKHLIQEGTESLGSGTITVSVNSQDYHLAEDILSGMRESGMIISLSENPVSSIGGAIISSNQGIRVDNTFESRLERYRGLLLFEVSTILLGKEQTQNE
ncbi:MAG: hypothetical protein CVV33_07710 [Methanomicrobiales archaeon HGW-Methanomicrobiales-4]|nr:MAG: hypothetical protein CVV33_07710 [Methanomicrobiales archaeon HGW-Methanomicrobiales-4]